MEGLSSHKKRKHAGNTYASAVADSDDDFSDGGASEGRIEGPAVEADPIPEQELGKSRATPVVIVDSGFSTAQAISEPISAANVSYVGSALKKAADGSKVAPRIVKKTATAKTVSDLVP